MAKTANQALYEATVRHQVHLLRFAEGQADQVLAALKEAEQEVLEKISGAMAKGLDTGRLEALLTSLKTRRAQVYEQLGQSMEEALMGLSGIEAAWETAALQGASPVVLNLASVPLEQLHAAVAAPISGIPLKGWLSNIQDREGQLLQQAVTQAVLQGETIDDLVRRIRGTKANGYADGILSMSTRNAQALARTSVNHVSNQAREMVWEANADIVRALRWTSTLDGRTSDICKSRDGHLAPVGDSALLPSDQPLVPPGARPPGHFNCRSVMIAVLDGVELAGDRPFVADERTRAKREADFRREAKERGVPIQQVRQEWAAKHVGNVPAATTYQDWLKGQPHSFQDEVLGPARAQMFRDGLPLERFVDASGKRLTLKQLQAEVAGDALNVIQPAIGIKAKGLLMQGLTPEEVLGAIKNEFPSATTSAASIASYKSELKKAGLLPADAVPSPSQKKVTLGAQGQLNVFESKLPDGLKGQVQGQWASVVENLEGHPGAYAHYKPGVGVQLSQSKLQGLQQAQAQQIMAHELAHLLHKQHDLDLPGGVKAKTDLMLKAIELPPEAKKLYSYYAHSYDELWAEIVGQAIHDSPVTSQGVAAGPFKLHFASYIDEARNLVKAKFPDAPPAMPSGPVVSGIGEIAGKPTSIGGYAKALLQQGMPDEAVLAAVKAEFPSAKTTMNSIKSYKSELKKAEQSAIGTPGATVHAQGSAQIETPKPVPPVAPKVTGHADPAAVPPPPAPGAIPLSGLTKVGGKPGGSNPGAVYKDVKGNDWLVKGNVQKVNGSVTKEMSDARARNEVLAARLLRHHDQGIAPEMKLVDLEGQYGGGEGVASRMLDKPIIKFDPSNPAHVAAAQKDFALHAWLGNYDVVGASFDNLVMKGGKAVNIDPGGAILFRAQGLPKTDFTGKADTWDSMRSAAVNANAAKVYGGMTQAQLKESAMALAKFDDATIKAMVEAMGPNGVPISNANLTKLLIERRDDILKRAGLSKTIVGQQVTPGVGVTAKPSPFMSNEQADFVKAELAKVPDTADGNTFASMGQQAYLDELNEKLDGEGLPPISMKQLETLKGEVASAKAVQSDLQAATVSAGPSVGGSAANYKAMTPAQLVDAVVPADLSIPPYVGKTKASWTIQKAAAPLFKTGVSTDKVHAALLHKFGPTHVPKVTSLASMKSKLKKEGLLDGPIGAPVAPGASQLKQPKLWSKSLGAKSTTVKEGAKNLIQQGQTAEQVTKWIGTQFSSPNPQGAADLFELAYYEVKTGKAQAKPGVAAAASWAQPSLAAPVPLRSATRVGEAGPPPPMFDAEGRRAGLQKYGGLGYAEQNPTLINSINKKQRAAGLEELTPEEFSAIKAYTGSAYGQVNRKLRTGEFAVDTYLQAWTDAAMHGLRKLPPWEGWVVRGMSVDKTTVAQLKQFYRVGAVVEETQFTSTSNAARGSGFGGNVRYRIHTKTGRDVKPISSFKGEEEVLLAPGTKYRVLRVTPYKGSYGGADGIEIEMEEVL